MDTLAILSLKIYSIGFRVSRGIIFRFRPQSARPVQANDRADQIATIWKSIRMGGANGGESTIVTGEDRERSTACA